MKKPIKRITAISLVLITSLSMLTGCNHYCSYGGCMNKVEEEGQRCSEHQGLKDNPNYGIPHSYNTPGIRGQ